MRKKNTEDENRLEKMLEVNAAAFISMTTFTFGMFRSYMMI